MLIKRIIIMFAMLIVSISVILPCLAYAEQTEAGSVDVPPKIVFVGDSIAAGYGLEGYKKNDPYNCDSYANILAEQYKKELDGICPFEMVNEAVSGDRSSQLLDHIKNGELNKALNGANVVVISIGGNDILKQFRSFMSSKLKLSSNSKLTDVVDQVSDLENVLDEMSVLSDNIDKALEKYEDIINEIVSEIKNRSDAIIIFQTLYDPFADVPAAFLFQGLSKDKIEKLDHIIKDNAFDENGNEKYLVCDLYKPFYKKGLSLTNMGSLDIHPNAKGHKLISEELDKVIRSRKYSYTESVYEDTQDAKETESPVNVSSKGALSAEENSSAETTDVNKDEIRLIISALAIVLAAAAMIVLIATKEKKK